MTTTKITRLVPTGIQPTKWYRRMATNIAHEEKMLRLGYAIKTGGKYASGRDVIWIHPNYDRPAPTYELLHHVVDRSPTGDVSIRFWVGEECILHTKCWAGCTDDHIREIILPKNGIFLNARDTINHDKPQFEYNMWDVDINSSLLEKLYASITPAGS